tara:strand:+ start:1597 stop:1989 length:393 start_codon:yes stop_codon:yes gene_type:complete
MFFEDLNEKNFILYAMKHYENPQCLTEQDFYNDLKIIKYIKRLLNRYKINGDLKERLILNHLIMLGNVFPFEVLARILFLKISENYWPALKTFLIYLDGMPEIIQSVNGKVIISSDIRVDMRIAQNLRKY